MLFHQQNVLLLGSKSVEVNALYLQLLLGLQNRVHTKLSEFSNVVGILALGGHLNLIVDRVAAKNNLCLGCLFNVVLAVLYGHRGMLLELVLLVLRQVGFIFVGLACSFESAGL